MKKMSVAITSIILAILFFDCTNNNTAVRSEDASITKIEINLHPAFNNSSTVQIDKVSRTVQFKVHTMSIWQQQLADSFSTDLDSFEANTSIRSFYSQSFLDSIRSKGNGVLDGLSIYTVVTRGNVADTINSGNLYPPMLSENVISQINYVSKTTLDEPLKTYLKDLKKYF